MPVPVQIGGAKAPEQKMAGEGLPPARTQVPTAPVHPRPSPMLLGLASPQLQRLSDSYYLSCHDSAILRPSWLRGKGWWLRNFLSALCPHWTAHLAFCLLMSVQLLSNRISDSFAPRLRRTKMTNSNHNPF